MSQKIVIALGGNALGNDPIEQLKKVKIATDIISDLIKEGNDVVIGHGNGPQVGMIKLAMDYSSNSDEKNTINATCRMWSNEPRIYRLSFTTSI